MRDISGVMDEMVPRITFYRMLGFGACVLLFIRLTEGQWSMTDGRRYIEGGFQNKDWSYSFMVMLVGLALIFFVDWRGPAFDARSTGKFLMACGVLTFIGTLLWRWHTTGAV